MGSRKLSPKLKKAFKKIDAIPEASTRYGRRFAKEMKFFTKIYLLAKDSGIDVHKPTVNGGNSRKRGKR
jgi:hypothetical protein